MSGFYEVARRNASTPTPYHQGMDDQSGETFSDSGARRRVWSGFAQERAREAFTAWTRKPTLGEKVIGLVLVALFIGLALLVLIPALALGLVALVVGGATLAARRAWRGLTGGRGGRADGRKNVRVIVRGGRA